MERYPQPIKRQLRELALLAVEKELTLQLSELSEQFEAWKKQEISSRELRHILHNYVSGPSRKLFRRRRDVSDDVFVADALARGILDKNEIAEDVLAYIQKRVNS